MKSETIENLIDEVSHAMDADILIYMGKIKRPYDDKIINDCRTKKSRKNILLILMTMGGELDAAYRITRCLQEAYQTFSSNDFKESKKIGDLIVYVPSYCKSAGTLICLGADKIIMSGNGELGPIDTQFEEKREIGVLTSGLTPIQAMDFLIKRSSISFDQHFSSLMKGWGFSTQMAADVAAKLTIGILTPIAEQIDPIRLAEVERLLRISEEYGERLKTANLKDNVLDYLIRGYPEHGFVIDRNEARYIFNCVDKPNDSLRKIGQIFIDHYERNKEILAWFAPNKRIDVIQDEKRILETQGEELQTATEETNGKQLDNCTLDFSVKEGA